VHPALGSQSLQDQQVEGPFETIIGVCAHIRSRSQLYKKAEHCVKSIVNRGQSAPFVDSEPMVDKPGN
jgi:hypothetical protein